MWLELMLEDMRLSIKDGITKKSRNQKMWSELVLEDKRLCCLSAEYGQT